MDLTKFEQTSFKDRTEAVPVAELKAFFEEDEKPIWTIKGLTAQELSIVTNAVAANAGREKLMTAITSGSSEEKVDAIRQAMSILKVSDNIPDDLCKRHITVVMGSVDPVCSEEMAVKIGTNFPTILYQLSQKIYALTGLGRVGE
jgi:hypothetical protein